MEASSECPKEVAATNTVRHAEKRRISTCRFADRIAQFCVDHYREHVPSSFRETQKQTCLAAFVAFVNHDEDDKKKTLGGSANGDGDKLDSCSDGTCFYMLGMGVGTKFLSGDLLEEEVKADATTGYGRRVRDCHAEVLARRAFRREILLSIRQDLDPKTISRKSPPILCRAKLTNGKFRYGLKPGVSLHMYTSSAPCGNATLKKFATMKKERFRDDLNINQWPSEAHEPMEGHSIPLGQFALLVKKESTAANHSQNPSSTKRNNQRGSPPPKNCPALQSTDWCPPGTTTVWSEQGSLHTCSDKICRWNCLGLQGSLLASLLQSPLYMSSLTVGRKLTETICRRAVCCRAAACKHQKKKRKKNDVKVVGTNSTDTGCPTPAKTSSMGYQINHPAIMGTAVYMDDSGVIEMSSQSDNNGDRIEGQDVRFHSTSCWAWWPSLAADRDSEGMDDAKSAAFAECIDGVTGFTISSVSQCSDQPIETPSPTKGGLSSDDGSFVSKISTQSLVDLHFQVKALLAPESPSAQDDIRPNGLGDLQELKRNSSPEYEAQKHELLTRHPLFRQWKRRETCYAVCSNSDTQEFTTVQV